MAVSQWNIQPSEFWAMTPREWWHIYEAKHGIKTKRYGALSHNDVSSLYEMMDKVGAFDGTSR